MGKQKFTPVMRIIAHADLPLPGDSTEAMLEGAKRNRALTVAMAKLGYVDTEISVRMNHRRVPETEVVKELPPLPSGDVNDDDPEEFARMARKLSPRP